MLQNQQARNRSALNGCLAASAIFIAGMIVGFALALLPFHITWH